MSLVREFRILTRRLVETERRMAQMVLPGRVAVVDHDKRRLRLEIGKADDGAAILSPWVRWPEASTGTLKVHVTPPIGTPMTLISGVFFPTEQLPGWLAMIGAALPLAQGVALIRPLLAGEWPADALIHIMALLVTAGAAFSLALHLTRRRLLK